MGLFNRKQKKTTQNQSSNQSKANSELKHFGKELADACREFHQNPGQKTIETICGTLAWYLMQGDYEFRVPIIIRMDQNGLQPLAYKHEKFGEMYHAYTGLAGDVPDDGHGAAAMSARTFLEYVANTTASGLILDCQNGQASMIALSRENIFRILYFSRALSAKKNGNETFDKKFLFAEKGIVYKNIEDAIVFHSEKETDETYQDLCDQFCYAVLYNVSFRVASYGSALTQRYAIHDDPEHGSVYLAFNDMETALLCSEYKHCFAQTRDLFERTIEDDVNGLLFEFQINQRRGSVFLSKKFLRDALENGYHSMDLLRPEIREFFRNEM